MSSEWLSLLIWLGVGSLLLFESLINVPVLGATMRPVARQVWLAYPLLLFFAMLLLTPWALWGLALLGLALLVQLLRHHRGMRELEGGLDLAPPDLVARIQGLALRWGLRPPDRVLLDPSDRLDPAVIGLWHQSLVLPVTALALPEAELTAVLAHELAHVQQRDPLKLWLAGVATLLLGWHPAARRLLASFALEVELEADRRAATWAGDAKAYVRTLAGWGLRRGEGFSTPFGVALTGTSSALRLRFETLLHPERPAPHLLCPAWLPGSSRFNRNRLAGKRGRSAALSAVALFGIGLAYLILCATWIHLI